MYIFGYGSLINSESRKLTGQTGKAIPAIAHGFTRHWSKIDESYTLSPLAVNKGNGQVNGVLLKVDNEALEEFDKREAGYHRVVLPVGQIDAFEPIDSTSTVWVYIVNDVVDPCSKSPIAQSYVDTVLAGCLEVSETFAIHFIEHTLGWHHPLINDRQKPKYKRMAGVYRPQQEAIDALMSERDIITLT